jgi:hypothetical protein
MLLSYDDHLSALLPQFIHLQIRFMRISKTFVLLFCCFVYLQSASQYVFNGNGAWSDVNNWQGGLKPPVNSSLSANATIVITGTASTSTMPPLDLKGNLGTITIDSGASLTINNFTQFSNEGSFIVKGTYINKTLWENYPGASFIVEGTVKNQLPSYSEGLRGFFNRGTVTIESGGIFRNEQGIYINNSNVSNPTPVGSGALNIQSGGSFLNFARAEFCGNLTNNGTLSNSAPLGVIIKDVENSVVAVILAPGKSLAKDKIDWCILNKYCVGIDRSQF